jgi:hypothetical protein
MLQVWVFVVWVATGPGTFPVSTGAVMTQEQCIAARDDYLAHRAERKVLGATCVAVAVPAAQ